MFFSDFNFITLVLMLSASLFFLMVGVRSLRNGVLEGLLYLSLFGFFAVAHFFYLYNLPIDSPLSFMIHRLNFWMWLTIIFSPALIILFISFGIVNFFLEYFRHALIKIYFGLTLMCFIFMLGTSWAFDVRGIITLLFFFIWFEVELRTET